MHLTNFSYIMVVSFIFGGEGNWSVWREPPTHDKYLTKLFI